MTLNLPETYAITAVELFTSVDAFLLRLDQALQQGLKMVQVRDKQLSGDLRSKLAQQCVDRCHAYNCKVLINDDVELATKVKADGVHFSSAKLEDDADLKFDGLTAASCHNEQQLDLAFDKHNADFAVLSPVLRTLTHVDAKPLGWNKFRQLVQKYKKPIYALGGLDGSDLAIAKSNNAVGLASMRAVWGLSVN